MSSLRASALVLLPLVLVAACTKASAPTTGAVSSTASTSPSASASALPTDSMTPTSPTSTSAAAPSTSTKPSASSAQPTEGPAGCATSALTVTVQRGSGAAGHQFAYIDFTNKSATCSLVGYPGVVLLQGGRALGQDATRSGKPASRVVLAKGATAAALLENNSTCNAANSDSVQVIVPNRTEKVVLPLRMRGCPLTIDPVIAS